MNLCATFGRIVLVTGLLVGLTASAQDPLSPYQGFTQTRGGQGGRIARVTTLEAKGSGSLAEALAIKGPRVIVFEVGGVIDLREHELKINEPFVTVAGQTAPEPGITLIRGEVAISTHDVILQHLRVRPGEARHAKKSGWEEDGIGTGGGAYDVIVDHCSCTWATDENLSASGPRFNGESVEAWRKATSHRITFSNCIIAEGLSNATHAKGEHSKGSLIHDNATEIATLGNLYANNVERNPFFKGGARGVVINNVIFNPGKRAVHYSMLESEWKEHEPVAGQLAIVGNLLLGGPDTPRQIAVMTHSRGPLEIYMKDNRSVLRGGEAGAMLYSSAASNGLQVVTSAPLWPKNLKALPVDQVQEAVLANVGARPWNRDAIDRRIVEQVRSGKGKIINSEQEVGGYPSVKPTYARFNEAEWSLKTMERRKK